MAKKYKILVIVSLLVIILDQLTKWMVIDRFGWGESVSIFEGIFNLTYVRNTGAAFGILAQSHPSFRVPFFLAVPVLALIVILFIYKKLTESQKIMIWALSLVVGGAIGNLIDRARLGYVVDFLDFHWKYQYHFPAFNVADSAICVGVGLLILDLFINEKQAAKAKV